MKNNLTNNKYRLEIDGLRAIAIIAVLFYHAKFNLFEHTLLPGGFLGVDVFFVISGYLLTGVIVKQIHEGNFKFSTFYYNRTKRILPALFFVFVATLPLAFDNLLFNAAEDYVYSITSAIFSISNVYFLLQDSYIAEPSTYKPFLHTWSLAVEEQFYLIVPVTILLLFRYFKSHILTITLFTALISLMVGTFQSSTSPDASFYLIHSRFWELLAGSILALLEFEQKERTSINIFNKVMPSIGLFMVINSFVFFDDTIKHPSYFTLLPVLGTMLMIWFLKKGELTYNILSSKLLVSVGLISFSLYLWHWPILVFFRIEEVTQLDNLQKLSALAISLVLSILTYYLIEVPFRRRFSAKIVISFLLSLLVVFFSSSYFLLKKMVMIGNKCLVPQSYGVSLPQLQETNFVVVR
jgi:peptidoglycan/LPS O-acetylase OafA/YrhL